MTRVHKKCDQLSAKSNKINRNRAQGILRKRCQCVPAGKRAHSKQTRRGRCTASGTSKTRFHAYAAYWFWASCSRSSNCKVGNQNACISISPKWIEDMPVATLHPWSPSTRTVRGLIQLKSIHYDWNVTQVEHWAGDFQAVRCQCFIYLPIISAEKLRIKACRRAHAVKYSTENLEPEDEYREKCATSTRLVNQTANHILWWHQSWCYLVITAHARLKCNVI